MKKSLIKIIGEGDELRLNYGKDEVVIILKTRAGRQAVLEINADETVGIMQISKAKIWVGIP